MAENDFHSEVVDLPSKGWYYPEGHPLSSGQVEIFYMTAKHEDLLTSKNLLTKGIVIDKLLEALIVDKSIKLDDMLLGDKDGLIIASRVLGYGREYKATMTCTQCGVSAPQSIDLSDIKDKDVIETEEMKGTNEFTFTLPVTQKVITFKLLTHKDEKDIAAELEGMRKISPNSTEVTTRMKKSVLSVNGDRTPKIVRECVDNMLARDAMAFREEARRVNPGVDLTFEFDCSNCGHQAKVEVPIDINFFWPSARV